MAVNLEELAEREKRAAAFHEAGHAVIARHFGGEGDARIWPNESGTPGEKAWRGRFGLYIEPPLPREQWAIPLGLAGLIAEYIADDVEFDDIGDMMCDPIDPVELSATDADLAGDAWTLDDVERTAKLLFGAWEAVAKLAQDLIDYWNGRDDSEEP